MKVLFFETENGMDRRAAQGGVYQVELVRDNIKICLYIGESVWVAARCGQHLYSVMKNPEYFGLKQEDLDNDELTLKFSIIERIDEKKSELGCGSYKAVELEAIQKFKPLTQLETSDRQIRDLQAKVDRVQAKMQEFGLK